jgi:hypothetical protein
MRRTAAACCTDDSPVLERHAAVEGPRVVVGRQVQVVAVVRSWSPRGVRW